MVKQLQRALGAALLVAVPLSTHAGEGFIPPKSTSTTINAGATLLQGRYDHEGPGGSANPFYDTFFALGNECLRFDVTSQSQDLEAVLIAPNGAVWRNDDRADGSPQSLFPLIKANTSGPGWYTYIVSGYRGTQASSNFKFKVARYPSGNPNCGAPTTPMSASFEAEYADSLKVESSP